MPTKALQKQEPASKPVGIWIRVSTEDQARGDSPEHHEKRARYYAEAKEWKVAAVYRLEGVSGKAVREHPEAQRMMADIRSGRITGLIFSKLARLARNTRDLLDLADFFREHDADLVSLQEAIDTSTPAGRLFYTMIAAMAQWEREEIADRMAASVAIRAKLGKPLGGNPPYGYDWKGREVVVNSKEAPVRKLIYELFLEHRRKKTVARLLNEAGYRTRNGSEWSDTSIGRLIRDPTAKGRRRGNYTRQGAGDKNWVLKPESEWVWTEVEPLVSEELWTRCNAILEERRTARKRPGRNSKHLFAGLTYCVCGAKMYVPSNTPKYVCDRCRNKIPTVDLEAVFQEQLRAFVFSPEDVARYLSSADQGIKDKEELARTLEDEADRIRANMERITQAYYDEEISKDGYGRQYRPLDARLKQIEDELPRVLGEADFLKIQYLSRDQAITDTRDLASGWPELTPEAKRQIVENVTERVTVGKGEVTIDLLYLPGSKDMATKQRDGGAGAPSASGRSGRS